MKTVYESPQFLVFPSHLFHFLAGLLLFYLCLLVLPHRQSPLSNSVIGFSLLLFLSILSDRFFESSIPLYYLLKLLLFLCLLLPPMTHLRKLGKVASNMADNLVRYEVNAIFLKITKRKIALHDITFGYYPVSRSMRTAF